jgi:hypothetical protein
MLQEREKEEESHANKRDTAAQENLEAIFHK